jgi:hypothetical protein
MPIPAGQTCANCRYLDLDGIYRFYRKNVTDTDGVPLGWCRETSPLPRGFVQQGVYDMVRKRGILGVEWPEVRTDDWCGRWAGGTVSSNVWRWNNQAPPPINGQFRTDSRDWLTAKHVVISNQTDAGVDVGATLAKIAVGSTLSIAHSIDASRFARYTVNAAPLVQSGYVDVSVTFVTSGGAIPNSGTACTLTVVVVAVAEVLPA